MQINKKLHIERFYEHNINFVIDLLDKSGKFTSKTECKMEYNLNHTFYFQWLQIINDIPKAWKNIVQNTINNNGSLTIKDHQII